MKTKPRGWGIVSGVHMLSHQRYSTHPRRDDREPAHTGSRRPACDRTGRQSRTVRRAAQRENAKEIVSAVVQPRSARGGSRAPQAPPASRQALRPARR
eukprot:1117621-Prymnesium_polylepis.1